MGTAAKLYYDGELSTAETADERLPAVLDGLLYHYPLDFTDESTGTWNKNGNYSTTGTVSIQDVTHSYVPKLEQGTIIRFTGMFRKSADFVNNVSYYHYYKRDGSWLYSNAGYFQSDIGTEWTFIEKIITVASTAGLITDGRQGVTVRSGTAIGTIEWKDCEMHIQANTNTNPQYSRFGLGTADATTNLIPNFPATTSGVDITRVSVITPYFNGNEVQKWTSYNDDGRTTWNGWNFSVTSGLVYSCTAWIYDPYNRCSNWNILDDTNDFTSKNIGEELTHYGWKRIYAIGTAAFTGTTSHGFVIYVDEETSENYFWVTEPQIEQKTVPTAYTATSRTKGVFNVTGSLGEDQGTIAFKHKLTKPTETFPTIMNVGWYTNPITRDAITFYRGTGWNSNDTINMLIYDGANASSVFAGTLYTGANALENHELYYAIAYATSSVGTGTLGIRVHDLTTNTTLYSNDLTGQTFEFTHHEPIYLGNRETSGQNQQGWYRDLSVYDRALSSVELDKLIKTPFQILPTITSVNNHIKEEMYLPTGSYYFPLMESSASLYNDVFPSEVTNDVYEGSKGIFVGQTTTNLLDTNHRNLTDATDITGNSTKTLIEPGKYRYDNDGTGVSNIRTYCLLTSLTNGTTYNCSVRYENLSGSITIDWCDQTVTGTNTATDSIYGKLTGTSSRGTYDSTYRFMDISLSVSGSVTLFEPQVQIQQFETPFADPTRSNGSLEFNLSGSIGLDWSGDWTVSYWKYPTGTHTGNGLTGYNIESLGANSNTVGGGYTWWGKANGANVIHVSTPGTFNPSDYFNHWHMVTLVKSGTTLTYRTRGIKDIENSVRTITVSTTAANYYLTQYGYDFKLGGWDNGNVNNSYFRDLVVAKRAFTDAEQDNMYNQMKVRYNDGLYIKTLKENGI